MSAKYLNVEHWSRRDQFYFFLDYDNPFFNICTEIEISTLYQFAKTQNISMFLAYLFVSLKAANEIEAFRYRLRGKRVLIHDTIHAGSTVLNQDETFSFCYFSYFGLFAEFYRNAQYVLEQHYAQKAHLEPRDNQDNMIHYSILPWFRFSSISHPRRFHTEDSVPKIVFGKFHEQDNRWFLPISISAHHSLVDGIHVGKYLELIQLLINKSGSILLL